MNEAKATNWGLINFASIEMIKACIFYANGRMNLRQNDIISSGVNFYYSAFHNCVSLVALSPDGTSLEKGIIEWKDRYKAPSWYIPCSHEELINRTKTIDRKFAEILTELKDIREYLSYGPYVCSDHTPHWQPILFTCEIENIKQRLESCDLRLSTVFRKTPKLVNGYLEEALQRLVFCVWGDQVVKIFKGELIFSNFLYDECEKIWLQIRKNISPQTRK